MPSNIQVFLDISIGSKTGGRVVFELFNDVAPKTVENFRGLCTGEYGISQTSGLPLSYKGCKFFRVVPGFIAQAGDFVCNDGSGGESIYGSKFPDESTLRRHCQAGVLSMANEGKNSNTSQFFVTLRRARQLDGRHVAFGQVTQGMDVLRAIEKCPVDSNNIPRVPIIIVDCGEFKRLPGMRRDDPKVQMRETVKALMSSITEPEILDTDNAVKQTKTGAQLGIQKLQTVLNEAKIEKRKKKLNEQLSKIEEHELSSEEGDEKDWKMLLSKEKKPFDIIQHNDQIENDQDIIYTNEYNLKDTRQKKLYDLRLRLTESRKLNAKEVAQEAKRLINPQTFRWDMTKELQQTLTELDNEVSSEVVVDSGIISDSSIDYRKKKSEKKRQKQLDRWHLDESAETMQIRDTIKKKKQSNTEKAFGWNAMNSDAFYRAHKKRTEDLTFQPQEYERQMLQLGEHFYHPTQSLVSSEFKASEKAKDRLSSTVEKEKAKRKAFCRRRMYIEDETVAYINDFNRAFNQKLEKAYGANSLEIRQNLERGTAL